MFSNKGPDPRVIIAGAFVTVAVVGEMPVDSMGTRIRPEFADCVP